MSDDDVDDGYDPTAKPAFFAARRENDVLQSKRLLADGRRPVLYLRPFAQEGEFGVYESFNLGRPRTWKLARSPRGLWRSLELQGATQFSTGFEKLLAAACADFGLVVGIGEPNERFAPRGLLTEYVGDNWQERVRELIAASQLVIMRAGTSEGVMWEVGTVADVVAPADLLVFVGDGHAKTSYVGSMLPEFSKKKQQRQSARAEFYAEFRQRSASYFPVPLPETIGDARLIGFDDDWNPRALDRTEKYAEPTVAQQVASYMYSVML